MDFEGIYCFDTACVRFAVYPEGRDGERIVAQISEDTLHDAFGAREIGDEMIDACKAHFDALAAAAIARYRTQPLQPVTLMSDDFVHSPVYRLPQGGAVAQGSALRA
ncbi:hypothetical protein GFK26_27010 [Variovorax paradoxus]|uniref:DUF1488 domain-containing protein n=1 Tax=Variovorax paradoxus TaxID=34073 RepID=A0A5Q0M9I0_VARPD|nr:hypothetical protein [Variovorax paradoxus]QFZ86156.1 hypothetical protein GFK26_27010 [Variovorax paradoxus]